MPKQYKGDINFSDLETKRISNTKSVTCLVEMRHWSVSWAEADVLEAYTIDVALENVPLVYGCET